MKIKKLLLLSVLIITAHIGYAQPVTANEGHAQTKLVVLSDIHFDPFANCSSQASCNTVALLAKAPVNQWDAILTTNPAQQQIAYHHETSLKLLNKLLSQLQQQTAQQNISDALLLGDLLGHDYVDKYQAYFNSTDGYSAFVNKTINYLFYKFHQTLPNLIVLPVLGNNDSYIGDYGVDGNSNHFYQDYAEDAAQTIPPIMAPMWQKQFAKGAFYRYQIGSKLAVLALNSSAFSAKRQGSDAATVATAELTFLQEQLATLKARGMKAIITMHIPVGVDVYKTIKQQTANNGQVVAMWNTDNAKTFRNLLKTYHDQVVAVLTGHLHMDVIYKVNNHDADGTVLESGVPGITPLFGNNPAYKVYYFDHEVNQLTNFKVYFLNLATNQPVWQIAYDLTQSYYANCEDCTLLEKYNRLTEYGDLVDFYRTHYAVGHDSQPISDKKNWQYYWCAIQANDVDSYQHCLAQN